jgi:hypothetical protein
MSTTAFWTVPDESDRYREYVRLGAAEYQPWGDDDTRAELAVLAWRRGTGPVMSPPYIRQHPRILSAVLARNDWDGSLCAAVDVLTGQPEQFRRLPGRWRDWPSDWSFSGDHTVWYEPSGEDMTKGSYLLASVSLRFTVDTSRLPAPGAVGADPALCEHAVDLITGRLNDAVGPVINRIEGS